MAFTLSTTNVRRTSVGNAYIITGSYSATASGTAQLKTGLPVLLFYNVHGATGYSETTSGVHKVLEITGLSTGMTGKFLLVGY